MRDHVEPYCAPVSADQSAEPVMGRRMRRRIEPRLAAVLITVAAFVFLASVVISRSAGDGLLSVPEALLLGAIEGVTEYLPVSSTGHLTITQDLLGLTDTAGSQAAADAYAVVIQGGAIVAVAVLYRHRIAAVVASIVRPDGDGESRRLGASVVVAFLPAGLVGLLLGDVVKDRLFGLWPTVAAWAIGGVVILVNDRRSAAHRRPLEDITPLDGLIIGLAQVVALWPGVSRSLVTILAASGRRFSAVAAVEFSFLLGFVTLGAATTYEAVSSGGLIVEQFGIAAPIAGFVASLLAAAAAVAWLVRYLERRGLAVFGWYRLALAGAVTAVALTTTAI